eukprot:scaffold225243_cov32-Tisochrysis_lutea.AAC.1
MDPRDSEQAVDQRTDSSSSECWCMSASASALNATGSRTYTRPVSVTATLPPWPSAKGASGRSAPTGRPPKRRSSWAISIVTIIGMMIGTKMVPRTIAAADPSHGSCSKKSSMLSAERKTSA